MGKMLKIKRNYFAGAAFVGVLLFAIAIGAWFGAGRPQIANAADITTPEQSGMTFTVSPDKLAGATATNSSSFAITLTDKNQIAGDTEYSFSGFPVGATAKVGAQNLAENGKDLDGGGPIFVASAATLGISATNKTGAPVVITLPAGWAGDLANLTVSRNDFGDNIVKDFDNGTFDYLGNANPPQISASQTNYTFYDAYPELGSYNKLNPDGSYVYAATGALFTTDAAVTPYAYWRDVRSHTNAMTLPFFATGSVAASPVASQIKADFAKSGKFLRINATTEVPAPNTFISFKLDVIPYTSYDVSAFATSVLSKGYAGAAGFGNITMVATLANGDEIIIGDSGELTTTVANDDPATMSDWRNFNKLINTANNSEMTISFRNNSPGGQGNDIGIDDISVRPLPKATLAKDQKIEVFPTAQNDAANTDYRKPVEIDVFANDAVPDGAQISLILGDKTHGAVSVSADGKVVFTPEKGFDGVASFSYNVLGENGEILKDINGANLTKTVSVNVAPPEILAVDDTATTMNGIPVNIDVLANDTTYDRATTQISVANSAPKNGKVSVQAGKIVYTPDENFIGTDEFSYEITDENGQKTTAKISVNITDDKISANDFSYDSNLGALDENSAKNLAQLISKNQNGSNNFENAEIDENQLAKINEAIEKGAGGSFELTFTNPDENDGNGPATITINVTLLPRDYDVTFIDPDDNVLATDTVDYGDGATAPTPPNRDGQRFIRWDKTFDKITGNLIVTAIYEDLPNEPVVPGAPNTGLMLL